MLCLGSRGLSLVQRRLGALDRPLGPLRLSLGTGQVTFGVIDGQRGLTATARQPRSLFLAGKVLCSR